MTEPEDQTKTPKVDNLRAAKKQTAAAKKKMGATVTPLTAAQRIRGRRGGPAKKTAAPKTPATTAKKAAAAERLPKTNAKSGLPTLRWVKEKDEQGKVIRQTATTDKGVLYTRTRDGDTWGATVLQNGAETELCYGLSDAKAYRVCVDHYNGYEPPVKKTKPEKTVEPEPQPDAET